MRSMVEVEIPQEGDWATHRGLELDAREVVRVEPRRDGGYDVWLNLLASVHGPFPGENYVFRRPLEVTE